MTIPLVRTCKEVTALVVAREDHDLRLGVWAAEGIFPMSILEV